MESDIEIVIAENRCKKFMTMAVTMIVIGSLISDFWYFWYLDYISNKNVNNEYLSTIIEIALMDTLSGASRFVELGGENVLLQNQDAASFSDPIVESHNDARTGKLTYTVCQKRVVQFYIVTMTS